MSNAAVATIREFSEPPTDLSDLTLDQLASGVREEHLAAKAALDEAVVRAINAGVYLLEAKRRTKHDGSWGEWVAENFSDLTGWSQRTAQLYMRFARRREEAQRLAHLGIGGVARALAKRRRDIERELADLYLSPEQTAIVGALPPQQRGELTRLLRALEEAPPTDAELARIAAAYRRLTKTDRGLLGLRLIGDNSDYDGVLDREVRDSVKQALNEVFASPTALIRLDPMDVRAVIEDMADNAGRDGYAARERVRTWVAIVERLTVLSVLECRFRPDVPPEGAASP